MRGNQPKKPLRGLLASRTWAGGTGTGTEAGRGGPAAPHTPDRPPAHLEGGRGNGGGGRPGGPARRLPGPGRIRSGEARRGAGQRRGAGTGGRAPARGVPPCSSPAGGRGVSGSHGWRGRGAALAAVAAGDVTFSKTLRGFSPPSRPPDPPRNEPPYKRWHRPGGRAERPGLSGAWGSDPPPPRRPPHAWVKPRPRTSSPPRVAAGTGAGHGADGAAAVLQGGGRGAGCWTPWRCRATRGSCCCS